MFFCVKEIFIVWRYCQVVFVESCCIFEVVVKKQVYSQYLKGVNGSQFCQVLSSDCILSRVVVYIRDLVIGQIIEGKNFGDWLIKVYLQSFDSLFVVFEFFIGNFVGEQQCFICVFSGEVGVSQICMNYSLFQVQDQVIWQVCECIVQLLLLFEQFFGVSVFYEGGWCFS